MTRKLLDKRQEIN